MEKHLLFRQIMAEKGYENTPEEAKKIFDTCNRLMEAMDLSTYLLFKTMNEKDVIEAGGNMKLSPKQSLEVHEVLMHAGKLKYGG